MVIQNWILILIGNIILVRLSQHEHKIILYLTLIRCVDGMANSGLIVWDFNRISFATSTSMIPNTVLELTIAFHKFEPEYRSSTVWLLLFKDSYLRSQIEYSPCSTNSNTALQHFDYRFYIRISAISHKSESEYHPSTIPIKIRVRIWFSNICTPLIAK